MKHLKFKMELILVLFCVVYLFVTWKPYKGGFL